MPGSTISYNAQKVLTGPGRCWLDVAVPASGSRITLHTDGSPESVANPNAKHLGMTEAGSTMKVGNNMEQFQADELTSPFKSQLVGEEAAISGNMFQIEDFVLTEKLMPGATKTSGSGYEMITFGGKVTVSAFSVAVIGPTSTDSTKFAVFQLYSCINFGGLEYNLTRKKPSSSPYEFRGLSVGTRPEGDQVGQFWKQV